LSQLDLVGQSIPGLQAAGKEQLLDAVDHQLHRGFPLGGIEQAVLSFVFFHKVNHNQTLLRVSIIIGSTR